MAAIASGWVEDNLSDLFADGMAEMVAGWCDHGTLPLGALWRAIGDRLHGCGCFDLEIEAYRMVLSLQPDQAFFQLRLAEMLHRSGHGEEARQVLLSIRGAEDVRCDALLALLRLEDSTSTLRASLMDRAESLLSTMESWSERHGRLVDVLVAADAVERASSFLEAWTGRWPITASNLVEIGMAAFQAGKPHLARTLFTPVWASLAGGADSIIPYFDGQLPAYDDEVEGALIRRVDAAFAMDEATLSRIVLPDDPIPSPELRVMMLTFDHDSLPNDLADHFGATAAAAGVNLRLYFDRALTVPDDFQGDDREVARRLEAFAAVLRQAPPDVLLIDCVSFFPGKGLNPDMAGELKARLGFRLVCVFRDAHSHAVRDLDRWLPVADTVVTFDPSSPVLDPARAPLNRKVLITPVPSDHGPFLDRCRRDLGLTFVGSVKHPGRAMPLSVLLSEDLDVTGIFGPRRAVEVPDTRAYARLLNRSRAVLNISCHGPGIYLVTGRVWETIAAGALLVEQDNPATARFFTPYRHYLPWETVADLVQIGRFVQKRPDQAARIADEAHAWAEQHYNGRRFWAAVLGHAFASNPPD